MLRVERISRSSACQRAGRAGRERAGTCARLYTEAEWDAMAARARPEIARSALAGVALELVALGIRRPVEFDWLDPPPRAHMRHALHTLKLLGVPLLLKTTVMLMPLLIEAIFYLLYPYMASCIHELDGNLKFKITSFIKLF